MKKILLFCTASMFSFFFSSSSYAQLREVEVNNITITQSPSSPKASLLFETEKGYIYSLPLDGMICFVPKMDAFTSPYYYRQQPDLTNIPNPLYKKLPDNLIKKSIPIKVSPGIKYLYERK